MDPKDMDPEQLKIKMAEAAAKAQAAKEEEEKGPLREVEAFVVDDHTESGRRIAVGQKIAKKEILEIRPEADPIFQVCFCCYLKGDRKPLESFPAASVRSFLTKEIEESKIKTPGGKVLDIAGKEVSSE